MTVATKILMCIAWIIVVIPIAVVITIAWVFLGGEDENMDPYTY